MLIPKAKPTWLPYQFVTSLPICHLKNRTAKFEEKKSNKKMDAYCSDCKRSTEVVFDHSAGDTVCSECGLVLESHSIDETSEWRTFANESGLMILFVLVVPLTYSLTTVVYPPLFLNLTALLAIFCPRRWAVGRIVDLILTVRLFWPLKLLLPCLIGET